MTLCLPTKFSYFSLKVMNMVLESFSIKHTTGVQGSYSYDNPSYVESSPSCTELSCTCKINIVHQMVIVLSHNSALVMTPYKITSLLEYCTQYVYNNYMAMHYMGDEIFNYYNQYQTLHCSYWDLK